MGRTLSVRPLDDLLDVISRFEGTVETLGLEVEDAQKEERLAQAAGRQGGGQGHEAGLNAYLWFSVGRSGFDPSDGASRSPCAFTELRHKNGQDEAGGAGLRSPRCRAPPSFASATAAVGGGASGRAPATC
jgi:hypothetical protein